MRAVRPDDVEQLRALLTGLSDRSRWLRFLSAVADPERAARAAATPEGGVGLVATAGSRRSSRTSTPVAIVAPGFAAVPAEVAAVLRAAAEPARPLLGVFMAQADSELAALADGGAVAAYRSPQEAARALGRAAWYAAWRRGSPDAPPALDSVDADAAAAYRGRPAADVSAFEDVLVRLSALAAAHDEVAEIDCDPVLAGPGGAVIIDARVRVQPPAAALPFPARDR